MNGAVSGAHHSIINSIEEAFSACFLENFRTILTGGAREPLYVPAETRKEMHRLYYREDYASSALHEAAHWCLAGAARREKIDFGYWYIPESRNARQQVKFEAVEAKPQALEWLFSLACDCPFRLSLDNCGDLVHYNTENFAYSVSQYANIFINEGLPERAELFFMELTRSFGTSLIPSEIVIEASPLV